MWPVEQIKTVVRQHYDKKQDRSSVVSDGNRVGSLKTSEAD